MNDLFIMNDQIQCRIGNRQNLLSLNTHESPWEVRSSLSCKGIGKFWYLWMKMSNAGHKTETYPTADDDAVLSLTAKTIGILYKHETLHYACVWR